MLLKDLIRFSNQHRTLYCYMILIVWIFLLITFLYKNVGNTNHHYTFGYAVSGKHLSSSTQFNNNNDDNMKMKKYYGQCSPIENITKKDDGGILNGWKLQGVLLVIRHGDRGPILHIKDVTKINCGINNQNDILLNRYKSFLINSSSPTGTNHLYWTKNIAFHGAMLLPPLNNEKSCLLGKLTYKGISQLLHLGNILQQIYLRPLGLYLKRSTFKTNINSTPNSLLNSDEILVYTTHSSRTFQSAMALLYAFLPQDKWLSLNINNVYSTTFCFNDCACGQANVIEKKLGLLAENLDKHSGLLTIIQWIKQSLLQQMSSTPVDFKFVTDGLLAFVCHNATLPCQNSKKQTPSIISSPPSNQQNDEINIDQDDNPPVISNDDDDDIAKGILEDYLENKENNENNNYGCLEPSHINAFLSYENWRTNFISQHPLNKHYRLLKSYGMLRNIVGNILKMISGDKTKFVLYSGHYKTIDSLTGAFGINHGHIPYISRLTFEIYRSNTQTNEYYFRLIYNGNDVTRQIDFCEGGKSLRVSKDNRGNKADLCPIENIIRFIHDDYFTSLNATNYKDACSILD